jgi:hypothetical protein
VTVLAVHDEAFQLDGDASAATTTSYGGSTHASDWSSLFDANGAEKTLPADFTASGFERDFNAGSNGGFLTDDTTTFATGSKDTLSIHRCVSVAVAPADLTRTPLLPQHPHPDESHHRLLADVYAWAAPSFGGRAPSFPALKSFSE